MTVRVAIYCRISDDREGRGLGVSRQEEDGRALADRLGWTVVGVYVDNDMSAYSGKPREQYLQLLADVEAGHIDGIIAWHNDRLHRSPLELEHFIKLVEEHGVKIQTVMAGELDLSTPTGRMVARQLGAVARYESEHKSDRIRRKVAQLVEEGKVHNGGPRPFGYRRIYSGEGPRRKIVRDEIDEFEAGIVLDCAERLLSGESLRSLCIDLNKRGIKTSMGNPWSLQGMRHMLRSGRIAGLKEFRREVVGPANWPAIIDRETHEQLRALLDSRGGFTGRGPSKYFLTGLVFCACVPEQPLRMKVAKMSKAAGGRMTYTCRARAEGGCSRSIALAHLEALVSQVLILHAQDPKALKHMAERESSAASESSVLVEAIEKDERRLGLLREQLVNGDEDSLSTVVASVRTIEARLQQQRDQLARLAGAVPLVGIDVSDLAERWETLDLDRKRAIAKRFIDKILIHPTDVRGQFDPERVEIVPRS